MTQKACPGFKGQSRSQAENLILSGWQGSDEDEDVNIDSSDEEKVSPLQQRKSIFSTSHVSSSRPGGDDSGPPKGSDTEALRTGRDKRISPPQFERSSSDPGGGSAMKVKSSDARRFRKKLMACKSGAKLAIIPRESSDAPTIRGRTGSEKKDRKMDASGEDVENEEILPGKSLDRGNKVGCMKESQLRSVGSGDKPNQGHLNFVTETRRRKFRDTVEMGDCDDEARKKKRYRELEQAQRIADRRLTLRERPESRLRDGGARKEGSTYCNSLERRPRIAGGSIPPKTDTTVRLRSGNEVVSLGLDLDDTWKTEKVQKQLKRKAKTFEQASETADKVFQRRSTRSTEKLTGDHSPSSQVASVPTKSTVVPKADSKDGDFATEKDSIGEGATVWIPPFRAVGVCEDQSSNLARKSEGMSLVGAETRNALSNICKNVSVGTNPFKPEALMSEGDSVDKVAEVKTTYIGEEDTGLSCKELLKFTTEKVLDDSVNVSEGRQRSCEATVSEEEKQPFCQTAVGDNLKIMEESTEPDVGVNTEAGPKPEMEASEESRRKTIRLTECTELRVSEIEETISGGSESQVSGDIVDDRESRYSCLLGEGAVDLKAEGAARPTVLGGKPDINVKRKASDDELKADYSVPELKKIPHNTGGEYDGQREGSAAPLLEHVCDIDLSKQRSDRCCDATGCKITYHLECADPIMTEVPEGKWYCPSCAQKRLSFGVHASVRTVDSIWDVRECTCQPCSGCRHECSKSDRGEFFGNVHELEDRERSPEMVEDVPSSSTGVSQRVTRRKHMELENRGQSEKQRTDAVTSAQVKFSLMVQSAEGLSKGCDKQYFVKWKNLSHLHNTWVSESELKKAAPKMLESFKKKLETEPLNQGRTKWKPIWQVPQRFLSKRLNAPPRRPGGGRGRGYLGMDAGLEWFVKWHDLGYEHCTWEQVESGGLDCEISKKLETNYDRWCECAKGRSHPARIEEVLKLREAKYKVLDDQPDWLQGCKLSANQLEQVNGLRERWHHHRNTLMVDERDQERPTTAVAFLLSLIEEYGAFKPILVVVPGTGCQMWESELHRAAEHVYTVIYAGTLAGRSAIQRHELNPSEKPIKFQIVLTTFDIAINDHDHLEKFEWEAVILDEGHRSRLTKPCRHLQFRAPYRLILLSDFSKCTLWELQQFLVYLEPENQSLESQLQRELEELDEDSQLAFLREKLTEKMVGDCSSHETTPLDFKEHWIAGNMTPIQVHLYCTELIKHYNLLHNGRTRADQNLGSMNGLAGTLRNVCNHPFLVDRKLQKDLQNILEPSQSLVEAGIKQCGKFKTLQLMVAHLHAEGRRVLLVCQTDILCYYFDDYMRQIFGPDSYECVFKGPEAGKIRAIQRFNEEDSTRFVFILKRNTGGVSFQLRETDAVIIYDSDWNPANDVQYLEKVIYKMQGQLTIYRLYTRFSVEEAAMTYSFQKKSELQCGIKVSTAKYCQQIVKWKVKDLFEQYDAYSRGVPEKELMAKILEGSSETSPDNIVKKILDGDGKPEAETFNEEITEEDGEVLKEFWSSLLRNRYANLQVEELTNAGKGLRSRKRVHYSEDALALASYAAVNEEEVKKRRRKSLGSELVHRGSPRANNTQSSLKYSPAALGDSSSVEEVLPAKTVTKDAKKIDIASQVVLKETAVMVPENTATGAELPRHVDEENLESEGVLQRDEPVQPVLSEKISTKSPSGMSSTSHEEGRKTRVEQQQIVLGLWRPEVAKIATTVQLSENARTYVDQLLVYCMKSYRMPREPKDLVLQVQIALCVVAAERFHQEIDHLTILSRVEAAMDVKLKRESWNDNYQKIMSCCKGYPPPESSDPNLRNKAQSVDVVSDVSNEDKCRDEDPSCQRSLASSDVSKNLQLPGDVDELSQTPECCNPLDDSKCLADQLPKKVGSDNHADETQACEKKEEHDTQEGPDAPPILSARTEDPSTVNESEMQGVRENSMTEENSQCTLSKSNKEQILEKLKTERHEINSVVVYQQTQEMNGFYRTKNGEKEDIFKRNEEITADVMKTVIDPEQREILLQGQINTHSENLKKFGLDFKEQHEILVRRQRAIRDEIHSVYSELLRQANGGSSRSLYDEAQGILAKMGVKSVAEAQTLLQAAGDEARRKKGPVAVLQGTVGQSRSQIGRMSSPFQAPKLRESNPTLPIQGVSLPPCPSHAGAEAQPSHVPHISQFVPSQTSGQSQTEPAQQLPLSQPPLSQLQHAAPPLSQLSQSTQFRNSSHQVHPNLPSVQTHNVHHALPPRPPIPPRENYVAGEEHSKSLPQHRPVSAGHIAGSDSVPSQLLENLGRTHTLVPSPPNQQQRTAHVQQLPTEQRNLTVGRLQASPIPHQQPGWRPSSTGPVQPTYTRLHHQPQQTSNPLTMAVSTTTHVNPSPSVAQFAQATVAFLPPVPQNMLGPDPILQEEARLKKERENLKTTHEKKASEIRKKFGEELEDATRKYEATLVDLKRKFEGLLDENTQLWHRQTLAVHQNQQKAHRSRLLAEALRNRAMFDIVYQPRNTAQQVDEPGSANGQSRSVQSGTGHTGLAGRAHVQPAHQTVFPMRHVAALSNESMMNTGSGQFVSASPPAGRVLMQPIHQTSSIPARTLAGPQREGSIRSGQWVPASAVGVPPTFPSGGVVMQHTHRSNLVPTGDVQQGQRTEHAFVAIQPNNNPSLGTRSTVPCGVCRVPAAHLSSSVPGSTYTSSPSIVPNTPGRGAAGGTPVQTSGRGNEQGGTLVGGLWPGCYPNTVPRSGSWQSSVSSTSQACTPDSLPGRSSGEATWNHAGTGSIAVPVSSSSIPCSGSVQPAFDDSHWQILTSENQANSDGNLTTSQQRRSWCSESMTNLTPPTTTRRASQPSVVFSEGSSSILVPMTSNSVSTERLPAPTLVGSNEVIVNSGTTAVVSGNRSESFGPMDLRGAPSVDSSSHPSLSVTALREPDLGGGGTPAAGGLSQGLVDPPSALLNTGVSDVPIIYLSDDD